MTYRVEITPNALSDLADAYGWIARESPAAADAWYDSIYDAILSLDRFPARCHDAPEKATLGRELRHLIVGTYRVVFAIEKHKVVVLHVLHGARLPKSD